MLRTFLPFRRTPRVHSVSEEEQIEQILDLLYECWQRNPDWRLGQLLDHLKPVTADMTYFVKNDEWIRYLSDYLNRSRSFGK